ncbi:hypothetical protein GXW83_06650 [Streptacidiphilus sp. PB12-B1b]|uniref:hypothetical protein n=1 Tax=Streptacidiphilus sp. PB12-B1b TaxID=2705012 RepID=UPI0015FE6680|nr:hypothetical protein [Streptacidiphilus sp. PB12-B1b]QMU75470.1 hypothetical protein GXW83_06650 [Streptacidiphilus sp. PB12-B1b]
MNDTRRNQRYAVPTGRPFLLGEFRTKLAALDGTVRALYADSHPAELEVVTDELYLLFTVARNLAPARTYTGCDRHPNGAIDPEAPQGWSRCLLCNDARRRGTAVADLPAVAPRANALGYPIPAPPYTFELLQRFVRTTGDLAYGLSLRSADAEFSQLADAVHQAFIVARELSRPRNTSGCEVHPGAPTDPTADGACLFCVSDRQRRLDLQNGVPVILERPARGIRPRRPLPRTAPGPR